MNQIQNIAHKNSHYELVAFFQKDVLNISLKELKSKDPKVYYQILQDDALPDDLRNHLQNTEFIFECLKDSQTHQVNTQKGIIFLKTYFNFSSKIMEKKSAIKLTKSEKNLQSLSAEIFFLRKELEVIKEKSNQKMKEKNSLELLALKKLNVENQENIEKLKKLNSEKDEQIYVMSSYIQKLKERLDKIEESESPLQELKDAEIVQIGQKSLMTQTEKPEEYEQQLKMEIQETRFSKRFHTEGNQIIYMGEDQRRTQALFKRSLKEELKICKFEWVVKKTKNSAIIFGLADKKKVEKMRTCCDSGNAICFNGINGNVWYDKGKMLNGVLGIKQGEKITMQVNPKTGKVIWIINSEIRGEAISNMLATEKERQFIPYVELFDKEDSVECLF